MTQSPADRTPCTQGTITEWTEETLFAHLLAGARFSTLLRRQTAAEPSAPSGGFKGSAASLNGLPAVLSSQPSGVSNTGPTPEGHRLSRLPVDYNGEVGGAGNKTLRRHSRSRHRTHPTLIQREHHHAPTHTAQG